VNIISGFADISLLQLVLVACVALVAAIVGGLAGYGTGALMPLVLVPLIGAEPVVPIIAISSIFTNLSRFAAYLRYADRRRALIVIPAAALTTALEHFPFSVNRRDSQRAANKILWPSRTEEAGNGVFERSAGSSDPGC
jgi:hypothetical protein